MHYDNPKIFATAKSNDAYHSGGGSSNSPQGGKASTVRFSPYRLPNISSEEGRIKDHYIKNLEEENRFLKSIVDQGDNDIKDLEHKLKRIESKLSELKNIQTYRSNEFNRRSLENPKGISENEKLFNEIENLQLKNNELSLKLAKSQLKITKSTEMEKKNQHLKNDNAALR